MTRTGSITLAMIAFAAFTGAGCLAQQLAVDTAPIIVTWGFATANDFGCDAAAPATATLPVIRIRSKLESGNDDDEAFDWMPCFSQVGLTGITTPLELGSYDVTVELLTTAFHGRVLAASDAPQTAILVMRDQPAMLAIPLIPFRGPSENPPANLP